MTKKILLSLALAAATFAVVPQADAAVNSGTRKEVLARVQPLGADIKWNGKKVESLEFNCDGEEDFVIGGRAGNRFYIAIILGPLSRPSSPLTADFPFGTNEDGALCEKTPTVFVGSMDYDPAQMLGEAPEGFQQSATCNEVDLGGECVKYHIYWNAVAEKLSFWK